MRHLDEGSIHAYLDGQLAAGAKQEVEIHLATCPGCRARLESEREIKRRAEAILDAAVPKGLGVPHFGEVEERYQDLEGRKDLAKPKSPRLSRQARLAWAATVVVALGLGWYARQLAMEREQAEKIATPEPIGDRPRPSEAPAPAIAEESPARSSREGTAAPAGLHPVEESVPPAVGRAPEVAAEVRKDLRALTALAVERVPAAEAAAAREESLSVARWPEVDREEAERRLGGPLAGIPGGQTVSIRAGWRDGVVVVRTVQVLSPGLTVELEQTPSRSEFPVAPSQHERVAAQSYRAEGVSTVWNGFLVVARGSLDADSLKALLGRLQRAQPPKPDQLRHY